MRLTVTLLVFILLAAAFSLAQTPETKPLSIYVVDVEGGNATLVVSPSGESLLIDTGNLNAPVRDSQRIMAAIADAGLRQIDYLITTHWHLDHFGGMAQLAGRIPIREFIDHGANIQPKPETEAFLRTTYPRLYEKAKHRVVRAGDKVPVSGVDVRVLASAGQVIKTALPEGGQPNPHCTGVKRANADKTENAQSIGSLITFGKFRALHLGDLSSDKEFDLMCPDNRIGTVDLWVVSHHGQMRSNTKVLVHAIESRVAIMNNGILKGGEPEAMKVIHSAPGLEDLWQLHFSILSGQEYTVPGMFIANLSDQPQPVVPVAPRPTPKPGTAAVPAPIHDGPAHWIKVSAQSDGSFTVTNGRNGFSKAYRSH